GGLTPEDEAILAAHPRPRTRGECPTERPCPFVSCRHHLYLEVLRSGALRLSQLEVWEMRETCSLDVAERGGITHGEVAQLLDLDSDHIQGSQRQALAKLLAALEGDRPQQPHPDEEGEAV